MEPNSHYRFLKDINYFGSNTTTDNSTNKAETGSNKRENAIKWCDAHGFLKSRLVRHILGIDMQKICEKAKEKICDPNTNVNKAKTVGEELKRLIQDWNVKKALHSPKPVKEMTRVSSSKGKEKNSQLNILGNSFKASPYKTLQRTPELIKTSSLYEAYNNAQKALKIKNFEEFCKKNEYPCFEKDLDAETKNSVPKSIYYFIVNRDSGECFLNYRSPESWLTCEVEINNDSQIVIQNSAEQDRGASELQKILTVYKKFDPRDVYMNDQIKFLLRLTPMGAITGKIFITKDEMSASSKALAEGKGIFVIDEERRSIEFHYKPKGNAQNCIIYDIEAAILEEQKENIDKFYQKCIRVIPRGMSDSEDGIMKLEDNRAMLTEKGWTPPEKNEFMFLGVHNLYQAIRDKIGSSFCGAFDGDIFIQSEK